MPGIWNNYFAETSWQSWSISVKRKIGSNLGNLGHLAPLALPRLTKLAGNLAPPTPPPPPPSGASRASEARLQDCFGKLAPLAQIVVLNSRHTVMLHELHGHNSRGV